MKLLDLMSIHKESSGYWNFVKEQRKNNVYAYFPVRIAAIRFSKDWKTLSNIQKDYYKMDSVTENVTNSVTENVTNSVTENVTNSVTENVNRECH
jgi:hypothetical protein